MLDHVSHGESPQDGRVCQFYLVHVLFVGIFVVRRLDAFLGVDQASARKECASGKTRLSKGVWFADEEIVLLCDALAPIAPENHVLQLNWFQRRASDSDVALMRA